MSNKAHARGEEDRQRQDRVERQPARDGGSRKHEQSHLARGVEAESEEHADRVHLPRGVDPPGERSEEPVHQPALVELLVELLVVVEAFAHVHEHAEDRDAG